MYNVFPGRIISPLLFFLLLCLYSTLTPADGRAELLRFFQEVRSLQANFEQTVLDQKGKTVQHSTGILYLKRPNQFHWIYREPYHQLLISDGQNVWFYEEDLNQVTIRPIDQILEETLTLILSGENIIESRFDLNALPDKKDGDLQWVALLPKRVGQSFKKMQFGIGSHEIRIELLDELGLKTFLTMDHLDRNPALDTALFRYTPPKGVDIIDERRNRKDKASSEKPSVFPLEN